MVYRASWNRRVKTGTPAKSAACVVRKSAHRVLDSAQRPRSINWSKTAMDKPAHVTKRRKPPGEKAGKQRKELYSAAYAHIQKAMEFGYFLEAVAICESIIGDRLEARVAQIHQQEADARKLLTLERLTRRLAQDDVAQRELYCKVKSWAGERNKVLHQMVKLTDDWNVTWDTRVVEAK